MKVTQRDVATALMVACIAISVVLASIPSLPLIFSGSVYPTLFGIVLVALAVASEGVAAFSAYKFFGMFEHIVEGRKGAVVRLIMSAIVGVVALVGNSALVKIGLNTANQNFEQLQVSLVQQADQAAQRSAEATTLVAQIRAGEKGALASTFTISEADRAPLRAQDERTIRTLEAQATRDSNKANSLRMTAAAISARPEYLMLLAILVLKFAEVSLTYLASSLPRNYSEANKLTNEERRKLGMPLRGRPPKLVVANG